MLEGMGLESIVELVVNAFTRLESCIISQICDINEFRGQLHLCLEGV